MNDTDGPNSPGSPNGSDSPDSPDSGVDLRLTAREDLVLEVLAARHRLGEALWAFESRHTATLNRLADKGLVTVVHGTVRSTVCASLTAEGEEYALHGDDTDPVSRRLGEQFGRYVALVESIHQMYAAVVMDTPEDQELHRRVVAQADAALALVKRNFGIGNRTTPS